MFYMIRIKSAYEGIFITYPKAESFILTTLITVRYI